MNYAAIDKTTKIVINNIEWDGQSPLDPYWIEECDLIPWEESTKGYPVCIGDSYNETNNGFIGSKPELNPSFVFNETNWEWEPPIPYPDDNFDYKWDENNIQWVLIEKIIDPGDPGESPSIDNQNLINIING